MLRETVEYFGHNVSARYQAGRFCGFAPAESTAGFIDTSPAMDGSRGIAFLCDMLRVNTDGTVRQEYYSDISEVSVIRSYESAFDDELSIHGNGEIRISDISLNKPFLKQLIDTLVRQYSAMTDEERERECAECTEYAAGRFSGEIIREKQPVAVPDISEKSAAHAENTPAEEKPAGQAVIIPEKEQAAEDIAEQSAIQPEAENQPDITSDELDDLLEEEDISGLSTEEQLSLLRSSIDEINSPAEMTAEEAEKIPAEETKPALTKEPESDDIYIEASAKLREICESGRLSMEQIEGALRENLLSAADAFTEITSCCGIPPQLSERILLLKKAADGLDKYFELGEDIAARAMFFMLYQMLSYSDRLAETEETKERLNGFFRRWGPSGITLSMLDRGIR